MAHLKKEDAKRIVELFAEYDSLTDRNQLLRDIETSRSGRISISLLSAAKEFMTAVTAGRYVDSFLLPLDYCSALVMTGRFRNDGVVLDVFYIAAALRCCMCGLKKDRIGTRSVLFWNELATELGVPQPGDMIETLLVKSQVQLLREHSWNVDQSVRAFVNMLGPEWCREARQDVDDWRIAAQRVQQWLYRE